MRCPTCDGTGEVHHRSGALAARPDATACFRCDGSGTVDDGSGMPDEDGELPIGWEPPRRQLFPHWCRR